MNKNLPKTEQSNDQRLVLAGQAVNGLLASQDPEKGWNLDTLAILSLKIADNILHYNSKDKLPDLVSKPQEEKK